MNEKWIPVSKNNPCKICSKNDWCGMTTDGMIARCMRVESDKPSNGGWIHKLGGDYKPLPPKPKAEKPVPMKDFLDLACKYQEQLIRIDLLAEELGVSERSLERLQAGFNGNTTFPMRDGFNKVIGIRIRGGISKWCVPGSHQGLFWPDGVGDAFETLVLCEGPTDCAALLTLDFQAIGRPSCSGGVEYVKQVLQRKTRDVIIMADNDEPKERPDGSVWYPGRDGAEALALAVRPLVKSLKIIQPPRHKDIRQWLQAGATYELVNIIIDNTEPYL